MASGAFMAAMWASEAGAWRGRRGREGCDARNARDHTTCGAMGGRPGLQLTAADKSRKHKRGRGHVMAATAVSSEGKEKPIFFSALVVICFYNTVD